MKKSLKGSLLMDKNNGLVKANNIKTIKKMDKIKNKHLLEIIRN
jgi:hypothetical protein